jgi:glycerol-1-phosphate dehydrogenase [NAD(P)+]
MNPVEQVLNLEELTTRLSTVDGAHPIGIRAIEIGSGALQRLPALLARQLGLRSGDEVVLLVDGTAMDYAGADLYASVTTMLTTFGPDLKVRVVVAQTQGGRAHADEQTLTDVARQVDGATALLTIGSGTLVDIGKAVSARSGGLFHVVVQTALSVNGYADDQSVLLVDGVKRTTPTRWPDIVIADTDVLAAAPHALNAAGVGDLMAMFTAPADWQLASLIGLGDGYREPLVTMVRASGAGLLSIASRLWERDPQAIDYVARVLTLSGLSMGAAGTTAPASGAEHTMSHLMEMAANADGANSAFHGAQVGACTVLAALVWKRVRTRLAAGEVALRFPGEDELGPQVRAAFAVLDPSGVMGEECWRLYRRKLARWQAHRDQLGRTDWAAIEAAVAPLLAEPAEIAAALTKAGSPIRFRDLDPPIAPGTVRWALANCHLMRDRFSIVDLAFFLGAWNPDDQAQVLADAARLGAGL